MHSICQFHVPGGNTYTVPLYRIRKFQKYASDLGETLFPLLLRIGNARSVTWQPVTASALLAEIEHLSLQADDSAVPGVRFLNAVGQELGSTYCFLEDRASSHRPANHLSVTEEGLRVIVQQFPPPVGFRSGPEMLPGHYECFFRMLEQNNGVWSGIRTDVMRGSGAPVAIGALTFPSVTQWDFAYVSSAAEVTTMLFVEMPITKAFQDMIHILQNTGNESLRLQQPLHIRRV